jgi:hypothetical protein
MRSRFLDALKPHIPTVVAVLICVGAGACDSEPCLYARKVQVAATESPFADGSTAFSKCSACPVLNRQPPWNGPATDCYIAFGRSIPEGYVACVYNGATLSDGQAGLSGSGTPNAFAYCENRCPKEDATLRGCSMNANRDGLKGVVCTYGRSCD